MAVDETTEPVEAADESTVDLEDVEVSAEELAGTDDEEETEEVESEPEEAATDETEDDEEPEKVAEESKEDDVKQRNREMAEQRIKAKAEREAKLRAEQQEYVAEADSEDPLQAAVRQLQVDTYNNKVIANTNKLTNEYERALKDFDILRNEDPVIQSELDGAVGAFQATHVTIDKYGNPERVDGDLYAFLQTKADSIARLTGLKVTHQEQAKDKEKSKVLAPPTRAPKSPKKDPDLEAFDEEAWR